MNKIQGLFLDLTENQYFVYRKNRVKLAQDNSSLFI